MDSSDSAGLSSNSVNNALRVPWLLQVLFGLVLAQDSYFVYLFLQRYDSWYWSLLTEFNVDSLFDCLIRWRLYGSKSATGFAILSEKCIKINMI